MKKQVAVIGLGVFGKAVASTLAQEGAEVLAIDGSAEVVQKMSQHVTHAVAANATDADALAAAGVKDVDTVVVAVGADIESSILVTTIVKNLGIPSIIARAVNHLHAQILHEVGATRVVFPEQDLGVRLAHKILGENLLEYIALSDDYVLAEVKAADEFVGKALNEIRFRNAHGVTVVAMRNRAPDEGPQDEKRYFIPEPDAVIHDGQVLVLAGRKERIEKLTKG